MLFCRLFVSSTSDTSGTCVLSPVTYETAQLAHDYEEMQEITIESDGMITKESDGMNGVDASVNDESTNCGDHNISFNRRISEEGNEESLSVATSHELEEVSNGSEDTRNCELYQGMVLQECADLPPGEESGTSDVRVSLCAEYGYASVEARDSPTPPVVYMGLLLK